MTRVLCSAVGLAVLLSAGCGGGGGGPTGPPEDPAKLALHEMADLLRAQRKPPTKVADLAAFEQTFSLSYAAVKSGDVVIVWGAPMFGEGDVASGKSGGVVAYAKAVPTAGGRVLFQNGEVKTLTADEFKAAPKADGKK